VVGGQTAYLEEGKCLVFDDSFLHEAHNEHATEPRVTLVVDIWHPDFSTEEIRFLSYLNNAQVTTARRMATADTADRVSDGEDCDGNGRGEGERLADDGGGGGGEEENSNFFTIIDNVRRLAMHNPIPTEKIWTNTTQVVPVEGEKDPMACWQVVDD